MKTKITMLLMVMFLAIIFSSAASAAYTCTNATNYTIFSNESLNANDIATDSRGNIYVTGSGSSTTYTITNGTYRSNTSGGGDVYITKYSSNGTIIFSTLIGGTGGDSGNGIAVDSNGNIYVTGQTQSTNFPTTNNAYQKSLNGGSDAFILELSADGSKLIYSSYLGGSATDTRGARVEFGTKISVDKSRNIYVLGQTGDCADFPTTTGAYQRNITSNGGYYFGDAFLVKFNSTWNMNYSTLFGGSTDDIPYGFVVDSNGNVWITGKITSSDLPVTSNAYHTVPASQYSEAFLSEISADGSKLLYSTFFGGDSNEFGYAITNDSKGNIYITGQTTSSNIGTTGTAYQTSRNGTADAYVAEFNSNGSLVYCTFFGGSRVDVARGIAVDNQGNIYLVGQIFLSPIPTTFNALQRTVIGGSYDAFIAKLSANGTALLYGSLLGSKGSDSGNGIAVDSLSNVYAVGNGFALTKIATAPTAIADPLGGLFNTIKTVKLTATDSTDTIYYTTDGTDPTNNSTVYTGPITINSTTTLKYVAVDSLGNRSPVYNQTYQIKSDVYVNIIPSNSNPKIGDTVTYKFKLGNNGPGIAKDVLFTYTIPEGLEYEGAIVDQGTVTYNATTRTLTWNLGDVAVGDPNLWLQLKVLTAGNYNIQPTVTVAGTTLKSNIKSLQVNTASATTKDPKIVNAAPTTQTVPMQTTGIPITTLVSALLMIGSGLTINRKK